MKPWDQDPSIKANVLSWVNQGELHTALSYALDRQYFVPLATVKEWCTAHATLANIRRDDLSRRDFERTMAFRLAEERRALTLVQATEDRIRTGQLKDPTKQAQEAKARRDQWVQARAKEILEQAENEKVRLAFNQALAEYTKAYER